MWGVAVWNERGDNFRLEKKNLCEYLICSRHTFSTSHYSIEILFFFHVLESSNSLFIFKMYIMMPVDTNDISSVYHFPFAIWPLTGFYVQQPNIDVLGQYYDQYVELNTFAMIYNIAIWSHWTEMMDEILGYALFHIWVHCRWAQCLVEKRTPTHLPPHTRLYVNL